MNFILLYFLLLLNCSKQINTKNLNIHNTAQNEISKTATQEDFQDVSLSDKIKSMIMIGLRDEDVDRALINRKFDHFIIFSQDLLTGNSRNVIDEDHLKNLTSKLKKNGIKLIAVDNEGGEGLDKDGKLIELSQRGVNRLYEIEPFNDMPFVGKYKTMKSEDITNDASIYAKKMHELGINFNLTPVVDVKINKNPDFFLNKKHRTISANPRNIVRVAKAIISAYDDYNIATSLKHFPGHGSAKSDSHKGFVDITKTWSFDKEIYPFEKLIDINFADSILIGHLYNAKIDKNYPSSMSHKTIQKMLREKLEYDGVVISDSVDMLAIRKHYSLEDFVVNFINAGGDIIIHANQLEYDANIGGIIHKTISQAVLDGKISLKRINESYERIIKLFKTTK